MRKLLFSKQLDSQLVLKTIVHKNLEKYKSNQPHVRIAKLLNEKGLFKKGDGVEWVVCSCKRLQEVRPVISGVVPPLSTSGYNYYWGRLESLVIGLLGDIKILNKSLDDWSE